MAVNKDAVAIAAKALLNDIDGPWEIYIDIVLEQPGMNRTLEQANSVDDIAKVVAYDAEWQKRKANSQS